MEETVLSQSYNIIIGCAREDGCKNGYPKSTGDISGEREDRRSNTDLVLLDDGSDDIGTLRHPKSQTKRHDRERDDDIEWTRFRIEVRKSIETESRDKRTRCDDVACLDFTDERSSDRCREHERRGHGDKEHTGFCGVISEIRLTEHRYQIHTTHHTHKNDKIIQDRIHKRTDFEKFQIDDRLDTRLLNTDKNKGKDHNRNIAQERVRGKPPPAHPLIEDEDEGRQRNTQRNRSPPVKVLCFLLCDRFMDKNKCHDKS